MYNQLAEDVYLTMLGELTEGNGVAGVENAYAPGGVCDRAYNDILAAYDRLRRRLGAGEEDPDVEIIMDAFLTIQRELCLEMFCCGIKLRKS